MFSGIIECQGEVLKVINQKQNKIFVIKNVFEPNLLIGQSISHDGVCLTVETSTKKTYHVTAIKETLMKSNLATKTTGHLFNLERCLQWNGRFDGHIVQGHVDTTAKEINIENKGGSWEITFKLKEKHLGKIIEKGSISINGTSLTCYDVEEDTFKVSIIPHTYEVTNFKFLKKNDIVNIEYDVIGKYVAGLLKEYK